MIGIRDSQNQSTPAGLIPSVAAWFRRLKPAAIHGKPLRGRKAALGIRDFPRYAFPRYTRDKRDKLLGMTRQRRVDGEMEHRHWRAGTRDSGLEESVQAGGLPLPWMLNGSHLQLPKNRAATVQDGGGPSLTVSQRWLRSRIPAEEPAESGGRARSFHRFGPHCHGAIRSRAGP